MSTNLARATKVIDRTAEKVGTATRAEADGCRARAAREAS